MPSSPLRLLLIAILTALTQGVGLLEAQDDLQIVPSVTGSPLAILSNGQSGQRWYQLVRDGASPNVPIFAIIEISNISPPGSPVEYDVTNIWVPNSWNKLYRPQQSGEEPYSPLEQWKPISLPADTETMLRLQSISANAETIVPGENLIISEDGMAYLDMQFLNFPTGWTPELEREGSLPLIAGRLASDSLLEDPPSYAELFMYQLSRGVGLSIAGKAFLPQSDLAQRGEFYQAESEAVTDYAVSTGEGLLTVAGFRYAIPGTQAASKFLGRGYNALLSSSPGRALSLHAVDDAARASLRWDVGKASLRGFSALKGFAGTSLTRFLPAGFQESAPANALFTLSQSLQRRWSLLPHPEFLPNSALGTFPHLRMIAPGLIDNAAAPRCLPLPRIEDCVGPEYEGILQYAAANGETLYSNLYGVSLRTQIRELRDFAFGRATRDGIPADEGVFVMMNDGKIYLLPGDRTNAKHSALANHVGGIKNVHIAGEFRLIAQPNATAGALRAEFTPLSGTYSAMLPRVEQELRMRYLRQRLESFVEDTRLPLSIITPANVGMVH